MDLLDPTKEFQAKHKLTKTDTNDNEDNPGEVDIEIYKEEVKQLVQRKRNLEKSYGLVG